MHASSAIPVHDWPTLYDRRPRQLHHYIMVLNYPRLPWAGAAQRRTTAARIAPAPSPPNSTSTSPWRRTAGETAGPDRRRIRCQRRRTRTALQHAQRVCTHPARLFGTSSGPSELADAGKVPLPHGRTSAAQAPSVHSGSAAAVRRAPPAPDPVPGPRLPARCVLLFQSRTNRSARHTRPARTDRLAAALCDQVRTNSRTSTRTALVLRAGSSCPSPLPAGPPGPPLPPGRTSAQLSLCPGPIRWLRRVPLLQPRPPSHRLAHHTHPQLPPAAPPPTHAATPTTHAAHAATPTNPESD